GSLLCRPRLRTRREERGAALHPFLRGIHGAMPRERRLHGQAPRGVMTMKRLHVHVAVEDLEASVRFYSRLFAAEPTVLKPDYAKWMLEDPRVNFAISAR